MQLSFFHLAVLVPGFIVALDTIRRFVQHKRDSKGRPFPPGPASVPLLGSAHSINRREPWKTYTDWHAQHGNILYFRLLDQDVIVLGSQSIAVELLEKRSQIYSARPYVATLAPYGGDLSNFAFAPYGDHWRFCRRIFHQSFRAEAALGFRPIQIRRSRQLVLNILNDPDRYASHYATFSAAIALSTAYGYEPNVEHDPMVQVIEDYTASAVPAATPEQAILLKLFPFLLHIPDWCPGSSLKLAARHAYDLSVKLVEMPYQYAEENTKSTREDEAISMVSNHLLRMRKDDESQRAEYVAALKKAGSSSVLGAAETTTSSLMVFTLAMILHPHVWKRAQAEIDSIVGTDRLPNFDDRPALPYVDAIIRETLRWNPVVPLGVWHATSENDVYNGHYIPKGAMVVANTWAMSRDEARFPNPEAFVPERFLNNDGVLNDNDPADFAFGFGRRICPGRYTADASLWSSIAMMLATLDFCLPKDAQGRELDIEPKWVNGITRRPDVFPCCMTLRARIDKQHLERVFAD